MLKIATFRKSEEMVTTQGSDFRSQGSEVPANENYLFF